MPKRVWKIEGYDGSTEVFAYELPGNMSVKKITVILRRLYCQHLNSREIVEASLRPKRKDQNTLLTCHVSPNQRSVMIGESPSYAARLVPAA